MEDYQDLPVENAPTDFDLSLTNSRVLLGESIAVEKCPICRNGKIPLFCHKCVLEGENLLKHRHAKSFQQGLRDLHQLGRDKEVLRLRIEQLYAKPCQREEKQREINSRKEALARLKSKVDVRTQELESKKDQLVCIQAENISCKKRVAKVDSRMVKMKQQVESMRAKLEKNLARKSEVIGKLELRKKELVKCLESHIFTLTICNTDSDDSADPVTQELADATSHQFVKGRWSYIEQDEAVSYEILGYALAASGECNNLLQHLAQSPNSDEPRLSQVNSAFSEWVAIGYASQFTHCMATVLDIYLPYMTYIPKIGLDTMTVESFSNFLAQLNYNIAYLSCSQGVDMSNYDPRKTLHNLYKLGGINDIGRNQAFTLQVTSLLNSVEGHITAAYTGDTLSDREGMGDDEDDWSLVSESLPGPADLPAIQTTSYASQATELMTSAVSVMSSLWPFKQS